MTPSWRPPYAYIPGQTPRHAEDLFDWIKASIEDMPAHRLQESAAWRMGLAFLREGYFWEAHEVLEAVWMACPQNSAEKMFVQAVIQRANGGLKDIMGRANGRDRLMAMAASMAEEAFQRAGGPILGLRNLPDFSPTYELHNNAY